MVQTPAEEDHNNVIDLSIAVALPPGHKVVLQVRDDWTNLLGTLIITSEGISYKRPNQKMAEERLLKWATLDKLMAIGLG